MKRLLLMGILFPLVLSACANSAESNTASGTPDPLQACTATAGNVPAGKALFEQEVLTYYSGCITCHIAETDVVLQGPSLNGVASRAANQVPDQSAAEYLCNSILHPNAYVVPGFAENLMPPYYANWLTQQELDDIVAYLLTLE